MARLPRTPPPSKQPPSEPKCDKTESPLLFEQRPQILNANHCERPSAKTLAILTQSCSTPNSIRNGCRRKQRSVNRVGEGHGGLAENRFLSRCAGAKRLTMARS